MKPSAQYHTGLAVEDLASAKAALTEAAGYRWCEDIETESILASGEGERLVTLKFTYSRDAPHLELLEVILGVVWAAAAAQHVGFWSEDVVAESDALEARGAVPEGRLLFPGGSVYGAFHRFPHGLRVELIASSVKPSMERWFATGRRSP